MLHPTDFIFVDQNYGLTPSIPERMDDPPYTLLGYGGRDYQLECFRRFANKRLTLFIAPTGSGKSSVQVFNAAQEIIDSNFTQKQVFVVPQLHIGHGFVKHTRLMMPNGEAYVWECDNLCANRTDDSTVKLLTKFLLKPAKETKVRHSSKSRSQKVLVGNANETLCVVVSYAALIRAFKAMSKSQKRVAITNTSFRLDEVHHICGVTDDEAENTNRLGEVCKYILANDGSLHLTTATFFRGDQNAILGESYIDKFESYRIKFIEHWNNLNLESMQIKYASYHDSEDLLKQIIDGIKSEPNEPPFIIIPPDGQKIFKKTDKWKWTNKLVSSLERLYGHNRVLDLVSPETQLEHKQRLLSDTKDFDAVVTCGIGKEGTDWTACSRIYNLSLDGNTQQPIQKLGRALRSHPGKSSVGMVNYIEHFDDWNRDSEKVRQLLSNNFNAILVASMLDDWFYPILMPAVAVDPPSTKQDKDNDQTIKVTLEDIYGESRNEVVDDLLRKILSYPKAEQTEERIRMIIDSIIETHKDSMYYEVDVGILRERLFAEIVLRFNPNNTDLRMPGMVVDFVRENGWDKVIREHIHDHSPFSGTVGTEDLLQLHDYLRSIQDPVEKYLPLCKETNVFLVADEAYRKAESEGGNPSKAMEDTWLRLVGRECYDFMRKIRRTPKNPSGILTTQFLIDKGIIPAHLCS